MARPGRVVTGRLLLVRHGRTSWNKERFLGRADVPLDDVGEAQARQVAAALAREPVEAICTSPLQRAVATAAPLAALTGLQPQVWPELSEFDCGDWQGRLKAGPEAKISKRPVDLPVPGGESLAQAAARVARFATAAAEQLESGCTAVVGHYLTNQLLVACLLGRAPAEALRAPGYRPAPGSVLVLRHDGARWRAVPGGEVAAS